MDLLAEPAGRDQRHPLHVLGEEVGELHRDPAAERVADDGAALEAEHRQQVADPGRVGAQRVVAPGLGRAAVADHVGGDHRVALGERWHHLAPGIRGRCDPVQQHQQRPLAGGLEADRMAVQGDLLVGPERLTGGAPARGPLKRCLSPSGWAPFGRMDVFRTLLVEVGRVEGELHACGSHLLGADGEGLRHAGRDRAQPHT